MARMNGSQNSYEQFGKISASSAELVQKMNEIVWALNIKNDTLQSLLSYINRYAVKFLDDVNIGCQFIQPADIPHYEIDGAVRRNIFLLVKEALNNIVKHSHATNVLIRVDIDHQLEITIHDNGTGFSSENLSNYTGNGLATMEKRANDLGAKILIGNQEGTTVNLKVPLQKTHTKV
jgi:signal transduction histidine kinase